MTKALIIKELGDFRNDLRRDVIIDAQGRPKQPGDREFLNAVINYGNEYLLRAAKDPQHAGAVLWFDIHFEDPAVIGMTWAYNPHQPEDHTTGMDFFWRIWTELPGGDGVITLTEAQRLFTDYTVQGIMA